MRILRKFVWLLFIGQALAQTLTTVTGLVQAPTGLAASSGYVQFDLTPQNQSMNYSILGTSIVVPQTGQCGIDGTGHVKNFILSGPCMVWGNDVITPANSTYKITICPNGSGCTKTVLNNALVVGAAVDLSTIKLVAPQPVVGTIIKGSPLVTESIVPDVPSVRTIGTPQSPYAAIYTNNQIFNNTNIKTLATRLYVDQYCNTQGVFDSSCFQNAVNSACAQISTTGVSPNIGNVGGAVLYAPYGTFLFGSTVTINCNGITIEGAGMGYPPDLDLQASTQGFGGVTYVGATVGLGANPLFKFTSPGGASAIRLGGVGLKNIYMDAQANAHPGKFDGTPTASVCLELDSIIHGVFEQFNCIDPVTAGIRFGFVSGITDSQDDQYSVFKEFNIRAWDGAAASAHGILMTENAANTANVSFNTFIEGKIYYKNGNGIEDLCSDGDVWIQTTLKKAAGGTGHGIHLSTATAIGVQYGNSAHEEKFFGVEGLTDVLQDNAAGSNSIYGYQISNGSSLPVNNATPNNGPAWLFFDIEDANGASAVAPGANFPMGINIGGTQGGVPFSALATLPNLVDGRKILCTNCIPTTAATCSTNTPAACVCKAGTGSMEAKFENFMNNGDGWYCR